MALRIIHVKLTWRVANQALITSDELLKTHISACTLQQPTTAERLLITAFEIVTPVLTFQVTVVLYGQGLFGALPPTYLPTFMRP